ncbi:MAG: DUF1553 domain-containing protein, partial [Aeoliella sp.]
MQSKELNNRFRSRRPRFIPWFGCAALVVGTLVLHSSVGAEPGEPPQFAAEDLEFFEKKVRPLLVTHCYECHGGEEQEGGLRLTSRASIVAGGDTGMAIVVGDPKTSLLIDAIQYGDLYQMPPKSKLPDEDIQTLVEWVKRGAPWPAGDNPDDHAVEVFDLEARKAAHWSWRSLDTPIIPTVENREWPADPLDNYILARLEAAGLQPAPPTDARALVRRAYFDLIGLPPPPKVVQEFAANPTPDAFAKLIDDLLASPQFGERWARHWLDLMRYAETRGHEFDYIAPNAWQYRDYVIRAFNANVPYDDFVTEHLAGDLLREPRLHPTEGFNESVIATGFWYLGEWVHSPVDIRKDETDRFDNAIDVYSKTFLGLTVSCARCHDHKFDAISQDDYYALAGFLQSSAYRQARFETMEHNQRIVEELGELGRQTENAVAEQVIERTKPIRGQLRAMLSAAAELMALGRDDESPTARAEVASRYDVSLDRLEAWAAELEVAGDEVDHPLYALALCVKSGFAAANQILTANSPQTPPQLGDTHQIVVDFNSPTAHWLADGPAFGSGPLTPGTILPGVNAERPIAEVVASGRAELDLALADLPLSEVAERHQGTLADWNVRPGKVLQTPTVYLTGGKLYYLMRGGAQVHAVVDSHRMLAGPLHGSTLKDVKNDDQLRWVEHDLSRYRGHGVHVEFGARDGDPLQVLLVAEGSSPPPSPDKLLRSDLPRLLASASSQDELIGRLATLIDESINRLADRSPETQPVSYKVAEWAANHPLLWSDETDTRIAAALTEYHTRREQLTGQLKKTSATAPAICDVTSENERLLVRGNTSTPGEPVPRRLLRAIAGDDQPLLESGSGRLELAERTLARSNPFPARVMVNRIWHHLMGRGIVRSVDNFGVLGQPPTHPQLLDHLATRFIDDDWSVKRLIRTVMLSKTYQMASFVRPDAAQVDPENLLFHRMPTRRLEAEAIRDSILALSGRLDLTAFGPSVPLHLTAFMEGRGRPSENGPPDGHGRRSIYMAVRRNFLSPMMTVFDTPQPVSPRGRRTVSNVPAQALILMNDPFVREQAVKFADRLQELRPDPVQRIERLYEEALARS